MVLRILLYFFLNFLFIYDIMVGIAAFHKGVYGTALLFTFCSLMCFMSAWRLRGTLSE